MARTPPKNGRHQSSHFLEAKLCSAWQQLAASKECFRMLKQDLLQGMAEANDIFNSMSVPLVRLVGLKSQQLAEQGRQTSVCLSPPVQSEILQAYSPSDLGSDNRKRGCSEAWQSALSIPEEDLTAQAAQHVEEFSLLQKQQLRQLVGVVKAVEKLVRSQEEVITEKFQGCESYLVNLQQSSLVNFKSLHQQVLDMRQQDSRVTYRLRVAEQSYQALMSLALKIQESGIDRVRKNLLDVKIEVEGMVNELASSMCKPVVSFLKELRRNNDAFMVVSKLQRLVAEIDRRFSLQYQTLTTVNDECMAHVKKMDFQLQVCNREVEKVSQDGEALRVSLKEKVEELEALKMVLSAEELEKQKYKAQLNNEVARACRLEEELRQKERKLAHAVELLQATKLQALQRHSQMTDACIKSTELCNQLAVMEDKLNQTNNALDSYLNGDTGILQAHEQLRTCLQHSSKEHQISSEFSVPMGGKEELSDLWQNFLKLLSDGTAEGQSKYPDLAQLNDAIVSFYSQYGKQESSRALVEALKDAVGLFTKHLETTENARAMKEQNLLGINVLMEQLDKNLIFWRSQFKHSSTLLHQSQQAHKDSISTGSKTQISPLMLDICLPLFCLLAYAMNIAEGFAPTQSCTSVAVCLDNSSQCLSNLLCQLHIKVSLLSKSSSGIFWQFFAAVAMATMSNHECAGSQSKACCKGFGAPLQHHLEKQRSDVVLHDWEIDQRDEEEVKQLNSDVSCRLSSCKQGFAGNKRSSPEVVQEMDTGVLPFSTKRVQTLSDTVFCEPQLQVQSSPAPGSVTMHKMIGGKEGLIENNSDLVVAKSQKDCQSMLLPKEGSSQSVPPLLDDEKGRPTRSSSKELWQVLELGTDVSCNKTMECAYNGEVTALEPSSTTRTNGHRSEPLLVLREEVQRRHPRSSGKRASPRLLARRLTHSPYQLCK
ncbi:hypothetical protein L7F22_048340 [Adiantum nelumboides]|nr:hypothetical protein [Adiantum nelumboides]